MSFFNGAPASGKFLADSVMADVIDYDEFLTGARSEATYTMFKGFMPKIAAIPASAIPIALMSTFGHKPPIDGILQEQDDTLRWFIIIVIIYIPSACAFGAFLLKLRFPLTTKEHNRLVLHGVAEHAVGREARDPCSGKMYRPVHFAEDDIETAQLLDSFPGISILEEFVKDTKKTSEKILFWTRLQLAFAIFWIIAFAAASVVTFPILMSTKRKDLDIQIVPVLCIVCFGGGITLLGFSFLRLKAAMKLRSHLPNKKTLKKLLKKRRDIAEVRSFKTSCSGALLKIIACQRSKGPSLMIFMVKHPPPRNKPVASDPEGDDAPKPSEPSEYEIEMARKTDT